MADPEAVLAIDLLRRAVTTSGYRCGVIIREAVRGDLPAIVALLVDDVVGKARDVAVVDDAY